MGQQVSYFGKSIKRLREEDGWSVQELAERATAGKHQVRRQTIWGLEQGTRSDALISTVEALARALRATPVLMNGHLVLSRGASAKAGA